MKKTIYGMLALAVLGLLMLTGCAVSSETARDLKQICFDFGADSFKEIQISEINGEKAIYVVCNTKTGTQQIPFRQG